MKKEEAASGNSKKKSKEIAVRECKLHLCMYVGMKEQELAWKQAMYGYQCDSLIGI